MTDEVKKVVGALTEQFIKDEDGNKVTRNNIGYLIMLIIDAVDGKITLGKPEDKK